MGKSRAFYNIDRAESGTLAGKVVHALRKQIAEGALRPGDRLPSRDKLARVFGVSEFVLHHSLV